MPRTKSIHNVYPEFSDQVVQRWQKAVIHAVAGKRLNPYRPDERIDFLLMSADEDFDLNTRTLKHSYENDVIELYSEREVKLFAVMNKAVIESGQLKPYQNSAPSVDTTNVYSDADIEAFLSLTNTLQVKAKLKKITSIHVLDRIKAGITDNHKQWFVKAVNERREELAN